MGKDAIAYISALHQGSTIISGNATWPTWAKVAIDYAVPFVVASTGYLRACTVEFVLADTER